MRPVKASGKQQIMIRNAACAISIEIGVWVFLSMAFLTADPPIIFIEVISPVSLSDPCLDPRCGRMVTAEHEGKGLHEGKGSFKDEVQLGRCQG